MDEVEKIVLAELSRSSSPLLESSSSSEEEEINPKRSRRSRIKDYLETIDTYSDVEFKEHFRLKRQTSLTLIDLYRPSTKSFRGGWSHVSAEKGIYLTIWYLANMESFRQVADRFDVTLSCAHTTVSTVNKFLVAQGPNYIKWPSENEASQESENFKRKKGISNIIGVIDGTHIRIRKPVQHEEDFVNRKGYHSMILQGVVNSRMMFIDIVVGDPGSVHDARVLRKSLLYRRALGENHRLFYNKFCLLGDSAYPSMTWLKVPHKDNGLLTNEQREYNYKHSATRIVVEHAYGLLKGRFRRLRCFENIDTKFVINAIVAACVLHNMCIIADDTIEMFFEDDAGFIE